MYWRVPVFWEQKITIHLVTDFHLNTNAANLPEVLGLLAQARTEARKPEIGKELLRVGKEILPDRVITASVRAEACRLAEHSAYYLMARRCGLEPKERLPSNAFAGIAEWNRLEILMVPGEAAQQTASSVLQEIERYHRELFHGRVGSLAWNPESPKPEDTSLRSEKSSATGNPVTLDTEHYMIEGRKGVWMAVDEIELDGQYFFPDAKRTVKNRKIEHSRR